MLSQKKQNKGCREAYVGRVGMVAHDSHLSTREVKAREDGGSLVPGCATLKGKSQILVLFYFGIWSQTFPDWLQTHYAAHYGTKDKFELMTGKESLPHCG